MAEVVLTGLEADSRLMLTAFRDSVEWSPSVVALCSVFRAQYAMALRRSQIEAVGCALHNLESWDSKAVLALAVRKKLLRSRRSCGETLYELAFG